MTTLPFILAIVCTQNPATPHPELHAAMMLGAKSAAVQRKLPVVHQVVLVPDEATYLDEISKWSTTERWPVLFNQEPFASQFIRAFTPEKVWLRTTVGTSPGDIGVAMHRTVAQAWDGTASIEVALKELKLAPFGVVITSPNDSSRTAAVALAAGRGQLLKYISDDWGEPHTILSQSSTAALQQEVHRVLTETSMSFKSIGDSIDALTLCMYVPSRVEFSVARQNPVAVSDVIGRDETGSRYAWTGWIFGSKANAAYMAMCSLFLERDDYWFCNTYPEKGGWSTYGLGNIPDVLPNYGINGVAIDGSLATLQSAEIGGVSTDVVYFTTKGNADFLDMSDYRTSPSWLPILNKPAALYFLHSWSLMVIKKPDCVVNCRRNMVITGSVCICWFFP